MWWILIAIIATLAVGYWWLNRPYTYWIKKGVKQGNPCIIFGDSLKSILAKESPAEMAQRFYKTAPNTRYTGFYRLTVPTLLVRDPDLIRQITVKDFDHFVNHSSLIPGDSDPLWSNNLLALTNQKWREMRYTLSPAFTSKKMKFMFSLISDSGKRFVIFFQKKNEDVITIEMKDTFTRFTNDVIASTAFGVECDSLTDRNNEFYLMGKETTNFEGFWITAKLVLFILFPKLYKFLKIPLFSKHLVEFYNRLIRSNIESRETQGIVRPDMIHLLLEARKNGLKHEETQSIQDTGFAIVKESEIGKSPQIRKIGITDQDITSQALCFFFAGFSAVSSLMCFMSYELGLNQDIQEKLIQEVDETLEACKGDLTYEAVLGMKYMDMVVSESLRKWPSALYLDRVCSKPYTIEPKYPDERPVHLEKDDIVNLPIFSLHYDSKYYPDSDRFDPQRFSDENKANIRPYTYLPFGSGPRNCIGSRFALLETKILFFYILSNFQIVPVEKTQIPVKLSKRGFNLKAEDGFWFGLKRRRGVKA